MLYGDAPLGEIVYAERVAEGVGKFFKFENLFGVGLFVDAVQRGDAALLEILRDRFVRGEHELFDEAVGNIAHAAGDALHAALFVKLDDRLGKIEVDGAAFAAPLVQQERQLFHAAERADQGLVALGHFRIAFEHLVDVGVGHALDRANYAGGEVRADHLAGRVHFHDYAHDQAVDFWVERADAVG